jgi:hypothetical protein
MNRVEQGGVLKREQAPSSYAWSFHRSSIDL